MMRLLRNFSGFCALLVGVVGCSASGSEQASTSDASHGAQLTSCDASAVPVMSSASTPSGRVRRSGVYSSSYEAWKAFDGSANSMWISGVFQTPAWIEYEWTDAPRTISRYALSFVNGSLTTRAPKHFTLQGWTGSVWVVVDQRTDQTGWAGVERREYTVENPGAYRSYRLHVTDDNDPRAGVVVVSLGKLELFESGCDSPIDFANLTQDWHMNHDLSTEAYDYYVPSTVSVPVARFVPRMVFHADGQFEKLVVGADDRHYFVGGTWARDGVHVSTIIHPKGRPEVTDTFDILELTPDLLRVTH